MDLSYPTLCLVTDRRRCNGRSIEDVVDSAVQGGVELVQLREKDLSASELYALMLRLKSVIGNKALLFINDRIDVALAANVDGVQLGEKALSLHAARRIAGERLLFGRSVHSVDGAVEAESQGADLLILGTIFPTASHPGANTGGLSLVKSATDAISTPLIAIGGIEVSNVGSVIEQGASGAAVISAITTSADPTEAAAALMTSMRRVARQSCRSRRCEVNHD